METLQPIPGFYPYVINVFGVVKNLITGRVMSPYLNDSGYVMVATSMASKSAQRLHRLLAITFIKNPNDLAHINHIDGNKLNNSLSNLEWISNEDNVKHAFANGLTNNTGEENGMSKLNPEQVRLIKLRLRQGVSQYKIAKEIGNISRSAILKIKLGYTWTHVQ